MEAQQAQSSQPPQRADRSGSSVLTLVLAWVAVGVPLLWGVEQTLVKAMALFHTA
jgi:hypothetical protein